MDRYTKIVLSVIAIALVALVIQNASPRAYAQVEGCGTSARPCYVTNFGAIPLTVHPQ